MLENYSTNAVQIIENAKEIAILRENEVVGSEHLLLALFNNNESICKLLLEEEGVTYGEITNILDNYLILRKKINNNSFTKVFEQIVILASKIAIDNNEALVYDEHLFIAILELKSCVAVEIINDLGIDIDYLSQETREIFINENKEQTPFVFLKDLKEVKQTHEFVEDKNITNQINCIMNKLQKNNPLLIGNAGVGKSAIVEGYAKSLEKEKVYQLDLGSIVSGTKYRGDLEEKIVKAIEFIKSQNAILFIDEIHNIVGAGSNEGTLDIANILKPYLARKDFKCIGATTIDEYRTYIEKDKALARRFQNIFISEPTNNETFNILKGIKKDYEEFHKVEYDEELISYIIKIASSFLPNRSFPDKAIDVLDELGSSYKNEKLTKEKVKKIIFKLSGIKVLSNSEINSLSLNYPQLKPYAVMFNNQLNPEKPNLLTCKVKKDYCVKYILEDLEKIYNIKNEMFLEIDLESYTDSHCISNLVGSAKGYVGYETGGILLEHISKYPINVIYFKNTDLACKSINTFIKSFINKKNYVDPKGSVINLKNTIFIVEENENLINKINILNITSESTNNNWYDIELPNLNKKNIDNYQMILSDNSIEILNDSEIADPLLISNILLSGNGKYVIQKNKDELTFKKIKQNNH